MGVVATAAYEVIDKLAIEVVAVVVCERAVAAISADERLAAAVLEKMQRRKRGDASPQSQPHTQSYCGPIRVARFETRDGETHSAFDSPLGITAASWLFLHHPHEICHTCCCRDRRLAQSGDAGALPQNHKIAILLLVRALSHLPCKVRTSHMGSSEDNTSRVSVASNLFQAVGPDKTCYSVLSRITMNLAYLIILHVSDCCCLR